MLIEDRLLSKRDAILDRWSQGVARTYPAETASFLAREKDLFLNPVGHAITVAGEALFEVARHGMERERVEDALGQIVRMRAVQGFSASQALSFFPIMKQSIREEIAGAVTEKDAFQDLLQMESRLDEALLIALDLYAGCRSQIDEIRVKEAKAEKERLLRLIRAMNRGTGAISNEQ